MRNKKIKNIERRIAGLEKYLTNNVFAADWNEKVRELNALCVKRDTKKGLYRPKKAELSSEKEYNRNKFY